MKNLWNDREAATYFDDLGLRVYTSRLLGREKSLVLHGGGNTSVKITEKNILGREEPLLYIKGSGWDLETIEAGGFSPVHLGHLQALAKLTSLSDPEMVNEMRTQMTHAAAPTPSVEAILHAILPYKYVDHTHADAVVTVTNTRDGYDRIKEIYGDSAVVIPYVMPGFELARACAEQFPAAVGKDTIGMVLMNHGIFSFGDDAKISYERMIDLVTRAERYLVKKNAWDLPSVSAEKAKPADNHELAKLRSALSKKIGAPVIVATHATDKDLDFAQRNDLSTISQQGPATPDHVIRTKRLPMLGGNVDEYVQAYQKYFTENQATSKAKKVMLDPAPRVILDRKFGICTIGRSAKEAAVVYDIYSHTIDIILRATLLGGYQALSAKQIFDVEYWDLEQAKLQKSGSSPMYAGEVALVTGAASGIGKACVEALLARGTSVLALDVNPTVEGMHDRRDYFGVVCDDTDQGQINEAVNAGIQAFGGLDMLILNAGIFPPGGRIESLDTTEWRRVMQINLDANFILLRIAHAFLRLAPKGGRVVVIGSKNVAAPGLGAAAYSASKAALNQLARVAALEWSAEGIRINSLHPDAVFDTGIWTDKVLQARANHYGLSVEEYKMKNLLSVGITSQDVAELAAEMCGPLFSKTTGAQIPIDGGNERVI